MQRDRAGLAGGGFEQTDLTDEGAGGPAGATNTAANEGTQIVAELPADAGSSATSDSFLLQGTVGQGLAGNGPGGFGQGGLVPEIQQVKADPVDKDQAADAAAREEDRAASAGPPAEVAALAELRAGCLGAEAEEVVAPRVAVGRQIKSPGSESHPLQLLRSL